MRDKRTNPVYEIKAFFHFCQDSFEKRVFADLEFCSSLVAREIGCAFFPERHNSFLVV